MVRKRRKYDLKERFEDLQSQDMNTRKRFNREIEKFHRQLKNEGYLQNSAVAYTEGIRALFRFYDMDVKDLPTEVTRKANLIRFVQIGEAYSAANAQIRT